jgi:hypothetical protein
MSGGQATISDLLNAAATQDNPIDLLRLFLEREADLEKGKQIDKMRFVGYVLELCGFRTMPISVPG